MNGITTLISFVADPPGWVIQQLNIAIAFISNDIIPLVFDLMTPNFKLEWFVKVYAVSFALAMFVLAFIAIFVTFSRKRNESSGRTMLETFFGAIPAFLIGTAFGPAIGVAVMYVVSTICTRLAQWGLGTTTSGFFKGISATTQQFNPMAAGGVGFILGCVLLTCMILVLLGVLFMLLAFTAMMYLLGALLPLGYVWFSHPHTRRFGLLIPKVILGTASSQIILFLLLGITFQAMSANIVATSADSQTALTAPEEFLHLGMSVIMMALAVLSPIALFTVGKHINPTGTGSPAQAGLTHSGVQFGMNPGQLAQKFSSSSGSGNHPVSSETTSPGMSPKPVRSSATAGAAGGTTGAAATGATAGATGAAAGTAGGAAGLAGAGAAASATGVGAAVGVPMMIAAGAHGVASAFRTVERHASAVGELTEER